MTSIWRRGGDYDRRIRRHLAEADIKRRFAHTCAVRGCFAAPLADGVVCGFHRDTARVLMALWVAVLAGLALFLVMDLRAGWPG